MTQTQATDWQTSGPETPRGVGHMHRKKVHALRAVYYWLHLIVDFAAAASFVAGSWLFFYPSEQDTATWLFLVGSICFAWKPTLRLVGRFHETRLVRRLERDAARFL